MRRPDATKLFRFWVAARLRKLARQNAAAAQQIQLRRLVHRARATAFGQAHGFARISGVADFQARVPIRHYEDFWRDWWQPSFPVLRDITWPGLIRLLALSSGTSGGPTKYIPVSRAMERSNRLAALQVLVHHVAAHPASRVLAGRSFFLGGSTSLAKLAPGVRAGDLSGIAAARVPRFARGRFFPPATLAGIADWREKIRRIAAASFGADIRSVSSTPSWLLLFFEELAAQRPHLPRRLRAYWPELELIIHGGVAFAPYAARYAAWIADDPIALREVYAASEGFFAIADRGPGDGMRLIVDNGLFYEFVPVGELANAAPTRHWLGNAVPGLDYALVVSSNAGLWAYAVGDTVRLLSRDPPRLVITGRVSYMLSVAGEHLTGAEIDTAMVTAAASLGATLVEYAAGARHPDAADPRTGHVFVVELAAAPPACAIPLGAALDAALQHANADYAAHRGAGFGMRAPEIVLAAPGMFTAWMARRGKLGGQNKVPRVIHDAQLLDDLLTFAARWPDAKTAQPE